MTYEGPKDFPVLQLGDVHDGDTFWLMVDQGLRNYRMVNVRVDGWDTPEITKPSGRVWSAWEQQQSVVAREKTRAWLTDALTRKALRVTTEPDPESFDRWVGKVYRSDSWTYLGAWLAVQELAVSWHKAGDRKWWQVYDRLGWTPALTTSPPTGTGGSSTPAS